MQCILYKIYFWKVIHMYYKLICILYALLCGQNFILVKSGCYTIKEEIIAVQKIDVGMGHIRRRLKLGKVKCLHEDSDGVLWFKNHLVVPKDFYLRHKIMEEAHCSRYSIHPRTNKMYQDTKKRF
jgi:spore coat polysaccharide biosynthesis predicted glycosyltransferase SpsG